MLPNATFFWKQSALDSRRVQWVLFGGPALAINPAEMFISARFTPGGVGEGGGAQRGVHFYYYIGRGRPPVPGTATNFTTI
jgi:hypothetical protein